MERYAGDYKLWILCIDDTTFDVLSQLKLPNVELLQLSKVETTELLRVKAKRSIGEYCWTLTPFSIRFIFEADNSIGRVTYLDADLSFRKHPKEIFEAFEASGKHVLITSHAYAPEYDQSDFSGQFCVQFMTFIRDEGEIVRKWWEERCLEWCYNRLEDGKFGDQKYLDCWPELFKEHVYVLENEALLLAPWNATRFPYGNSVCWHFHGFKIVECKRKYIYFYGGYNIPDVALKSIYATYVEDIQTALKTLSNYNIAFTPYSDYRHAKIKLYLEPLLRIVRKLLGRTYSQFSQHSKKE